MYNLVSCSSPWSSLAPLYDCSNKGIGTKQCKETHHQASVTVNIFSHTTSTKAQHVSPSVIFATGNFSHFYLLNFFLSRSCNTYACTYG
jgi:hypothetical protein